MSTDKEKVLIAVVDARLAESGQPGFGTRWRMRFAANRARRLRARGITIRYALVPHPSAAKKEQLLALVTALNKCDPVYAGQYHTPAIGVMVPVRSQVDFVRMTAVKTESRFFIY